ncbi:MAG: acyl-CoA thioesterase, partial [Pirellulaceae bacterium]
SIPYFVLLRFVSSFCGSLFVNLRFHGILGQMPVNGYGSPTMPCQVTGRCQVKERTATRTMPAIFHHYHRVLDSEIDELDHANNAVYVHWMQAAAIAHSTAQGWPSERYWNASFAWVARSHKIEYIQPAFAGDELVVHTWVADMQRVSSLRRYEILRVADNTVVARAETRWVFVDLQSRKPTRIPPEVQADFVIVPDGERRAD